MTASGPARLIGNAHNGAVSAHGGTTSEASESAVTLAIVGAGSRGADAYARFALQQPQSARVVADAERGRRVAEQHGLPDDSLYPGWRPLLAAGRQADGLIIATPDRLHLEPALAAPGARLEGTCRVLEDGHAALVAHVEGRRHHRPARRAHLLGQRIDVVGADVQGPDCRLALLLSRPDPGSVLAVNLGQAVAAVRRILAEVVDRLIRMGGWDAVALRQRVNWLIAGGLEVEPVWVPIARRAGRLRAEHYQRTDRPLSVSDCICLATAIQLGGQLATTDSVLAATARSLGVAVVALPNSAGQRPT